MASRMNHEAVFQALKALAEPNRLRIFSRLMEGDSCNCELGDQLGLAPNLLSHHLRVLSQAGMISSRRDRLDGRWIYYSVEPQMVDALAEAMATLFDLSQRTRRDCVCGPEGQLLEEPCVSPQRIPTRA